MRSKLSTTVLLFGIISLIIAWAPAATAKTAFFKYSQDHGETISIWLSNQQLKIQLSGDGNSQDLLFRADTSPSILYLVHGSNGVKITEPALRRVVAHLNIRYEQMQKNMQKTLQNLPEDKRQQLKDNMPSFKEINIDSPPEVRFKTGKDTSWQGRPAVKGQFFVNQKPRAEAILFSKPPLELTEAQVNTLNAFQDQLTNWIEIVSRQPMFTGGENPFRDTQNLIGNYYPRLAWLREKDKQLELIQWRQIDGKKNIFQLPEDIKIRSIDLDLFKSNQKR